MQCCHSTTVTAQVIACPLIPSLIITLSTQLLPVLFSPFNLVQFGPDDERLEAIYDRLDELDPTTFEPRASQLLHGLGFSKAMMQ